MTRHVDAEELARFREGDLNRWRSWRVRSHLRQCAECRELDSELAEIPALLASVSKPPMPEHVTAMIQSALAHEATLRATGAQPAATEATGATSATTGPATTGPAATRAGGKGTGRWRQRNWRLPPAGWPLALRAAAAAAAVVVLAVGGLEIAQHSGGSPSRSAAPGAPVAAPFNNTGKTEPGPALSYTRDGQQYHITPISTHTNFTLGGLNRQVSKLVRSRSSAAAPGPATNGSSASAAGASSGQATFDNFAVSSLDGCLNRIAAGTLVILVDVDRFQDSPATVIVTEVSAPGPIQIWVVGTGCTASSSDTLAHTLLTPGS